MRTIYCAEPGEENMDHNEAVQLMAVERYLLDEMTSELRDEFEEHMFDCAECALDLRAGSAFVQEAKLQLPQLAANEAAAGTAASARPVSRPQPKSRDWFAWLRPAFAVPAFAALLIVIGYQNIETIPSLRASAASPRITPWTSFHTGTRSAARLDVPADHKQGAGVVIELPQESAYASYVFDLYDQQGKLFWTHTVLASGPNASGNGGFLLTIPGAGLEQSSYTLVIAGTDQQGARTEVDRHILDVHFDQ
jgi:anti-sigma factor RsiW